MAQTQTDTNTQGISRLLWDALAVLIADDGDMAQHKNNRGLSGSDTGPCHAIFDAGFDALTRGQAVWLHKALRKYAQTQLEPAGIRYADIPDPAVGGAAPRKDAATITLEDGSLIFRSNRDHPAVTLVKDLAHRRWTGAEGTPKFCWRVALDEKNLGGLREIYRLGTVAFDDAAIAALKGLASPPSGRSTTSGSTGQLPLADAPRPAQARPGAPTERVAVTPEVCANLRGQNGTGPSVDRTSAVAGGDAGHGLTAPTSDAPSFVRVVYTLAPDNSLQYHLKRTPEGHILTGPGTGPFASVHDAQDAATRLNKKTQETIQ